MTLSLDELRQILVEDWCVVSPERWLTLTREFSDPDSILDRLSSDVRFRLARSELPHVTPFMRRALSSGAAKEFVVQLHLKKWLKLRPLQTGGQGEVWIACPCDPAAKADQLVALKMSASRGSDPPEVLQQEILVLRKIQSAHIANLVDADGATGILATRFIDGESLADKVQSERRLTVGQTVQIGIEVCEALQILHSIGLIHKDVKPDNIILDRAHRAVLIDFGLAEDPVLAPPRPGGTQYYMAPEVFFNLFSADARADVYSLAATLYHALAGQTPHFQQCLNPRLYHASRAELDELSFRLGATECDLEDVRRDTPRPLSQLLCSALAANREQRPASAEYFRQLLMEIQRHLYEAVQVEHELWGLAQALLTAYRDIHLDKADYSDQKNASAIADDLERLPQQYPALSRLQPTDAWLGTVSAHSLVPRTTKILARIDALVTQLDVYLANPGGVDKDLLKDLIVQTLEGMRSLSVKALAAAHDWHAVLLQLGIFKRQ